MSTSLRDAKSVQVRFNTTPQLHAALVEVATRHDVPVAHIIRHALRDYLKGQVTK
jgi:2-keto-3-deoxy-6-phosphogluconate aldolase